MKNNLRVLVGFIFLLPQLLVFQIVKIGGAVLPMTFIDGNR
jgi:hypothetical protein